jgi:hypothetical protein
MQGKYKGSCYIGVVGSETENGECRDSIESIVRQKKDTDPIYIRATKGYEARQMHLNNWYEKTKHPFMLLLDHDMKFPAFTLQRLRSYGLPYISGLYMRRRYNPVAPVWFEYGELGQMPMIPMTMALQDNTLYKIGASGWGCILIHRDVITAMKPILKGEQEIIEDDMDVYPYDLNVVMSTLNELDMLSNGRKTPDNEFAIRECVERLQSELKPLRGLKDIVGSDIRFPFYARLAGFDLHGDTGVMCEHMLNYPLSPNDYLNQSARNVRDLGVAIYHNAKLEQEKIRQTIGKYTNEKG